jgi:hypothetical protein
MEGKRREIEQVRRQRGREKLRKLLTVFSKL